MDMETLGTGPKSIILSIAVIAAKEGLTISNQEDLEQIPRLIVRPSLDEQEQRFHRTIDLRTIRWWSNQKPQLFYDNLNSSSDSCISSYRLITNFLMDHGFDRELKECIWSRGMFEGPLWDSLCCDLGVKNPISFWRWRDSRTACSILGTDQRILDKFNFTKHNPIDDCLIDYLLITQSNNNPYGTFN